MAKTTPNSVSDRGVRTVARRLLWLAYQADSTVGTFKAVTDVIKELTPEAFSEVRMLMMIALDDEHDARMAESTRRNLGGYREDYVTVMAAIHDVEYERSTTKPV